MANIQVTYGATSRHLTITSTTTWSEIETQFRALFNIPQEILITVSYTDEEGDKITLSSDLEFQEVLSSSSNDAIEFVITTSGVNNLNRERSIDEETSNLINGISVIQFEDNGSSRHNANQQQSSSQSSSNNHTQENKKINENQENSDDEPEIIVIIARNPWSHRRRERFNGCNPYYPYYASCGRSFHGCHRNSPSEFQQGCGRYYRRHQQISPEIVTEKVNILHSMGFVNENLEELVKKYNGNLEMIIEVLLHHQRNEQNNETKKKEEVSKDEDQPMEIEENKPYVL